MTSRVVFGLDELLEQCGYGCGEGASTMPELVAAMRSCRDRGFSIAVAVPHPLASAAANGPDALTEANARVEWLVSALAGHDLTIDELLVGQIEIAAHDWLIDDKALTVEEFAAGDPEGFAAILQSEEAGA
ncbi:MAG: hypothetical protein KJZ64_16140 [Sphingomonadaceae bacterium]|nr:hypothetical protein [Sphingomonadaceae bacterium]